MNINKEKKMELPTAKDGLIEIREVQIKYNKKIEQAPVKSGWNSFTNTKTASKRDLERAKFNAVKAIVQDYSIYGISLLSEETLEQITVQGKQYSIKEKK